MLLRLFHKLKVYTLSETIAKGLNWGLLLVLPMIVSSESFGVIALLVALENFLLPLILGGQQTVILRFFNRFKKNESKFISVVLSVFKKWLIVIPFAIIITFFLYNNLGLTLLVLLVPLLGIRELALTTYRVKEDFKSYISLRIVFQLIKFISIISFSLILTDSSLAYTFGLAIASIISVIQILTNRIFSTPSYKNKNLEKKLFLFGFPIVFHVLSVTIMSFFDRYMIDMYLDKESVAIYSFVYSISFSLFFFMTLGNLIFQPSFYKFKTYTPKSEQFLSVYTNVMFLGVSFMALVLYLSYDTILSFYGEEYHNSTSLFIILVATLIIGPFYQQGNLRLTLQNKTNLLPWVTSVSAVFNIVLNLILIPRFGMIGAAYSTLISTGLLVISINLVSSKNKISIAKLCFSLAIIIIAVLLKYLALLIIPMLLSFVEIISKRKVLTTSI